MAIFSISLRLLIPLKGVLKRVLFRAFLWPCYFFYNGLFPAKRGKTGWPDFAQAARSGDRLFCQGFDVHLQRLHGNAVSIDAFALQGAFDALVDHACQIGLGPGFFHAFAVGVT